MYLGPIMVQRFYVFYLQGKNHARYTNINVYFICLQFLKNVGSVFLNQNITFTCYVTVVRGGCHGCARCACYCRATRDVTYLSAYLQIRDVANPLWYSRVRDDTNTWRCLYIRDVTNTWRCLYICDETNSTAAPLIRDVNCSNNNHRDYLLTKQFLT